MPHNQQSTTECSIDTASPPSYNHTAPPPPYTAHARLGEVSIQRSPLQEDGIISDYLLVDDGDQATVGWLDDTVQEHADDMYDDMLYPADPEEPVATENSGEISHRSFHEDQPAPIAASTPSGSLNELVFVKSLAHNNNLPSVKPPMLRPLRAQNFSAPNLFATYPPPSTTTHEIDSTLNNTLPRIGRLPPLRRKPNLMNNSPRYVRSHSDSRLPSPFYDNYRTLSHSVSVGEYEPISEVSHEPSSSETIDN